MICTSKASPNALRSNASGVHRRLPLWFNILPTGWHTMRNWRLITGSTSMTSGITLRPVAILATLALLPAISPAALEIDQLLTRLARPAPASTPFVEVRYSKLLDQPIVVQGELEYLEGGVLARTVNRPFHERT